VPRWAITLVMVTWSQWVTCHISKCDIVTWKMCRWPCTIKMWQVTFFDTSDSCLLRCMVGALGLTPSLRGATSVTCGIATDHWAVFHGTIVSSLWPTAGVRGATSVTCDIATDIALEYLLCMLIPVMLDREELFWCCKNALDINNGMSYTRRKWWFPWQVCCSGS
jgi:hypothetical protein